MKSNPLALAVGALVLAGASAQATADVTANVGAVSNYVWRGVTQTDTGSAIQGGVDYSHDNGLSAGTWVSNVSGGTEMDLYAGFDREIGDFSFGLNTIYYMYPDLKDFNFWEIGGSVGYKFASLGVQYTIDGQADEPSAFRKGDLYYYTSLSFDLPQSFSIGGTFGYYDFVDLGDNDGDMTGDYVHWQLSLSKDAGDFGSFSLNYDETDQADTDAQMWVGWSKEF